MNIKKICSALMSGIMAVGMFTGMSMSDAAKKSPLGAVQQTLESLSLEAEPLTANAAGTMRRPCDPDHPMLIVHIDTWNVADPAKIISLIPEDIKPYAVFNISMSINWSNDEHKWLMTQDGYELAKSWLKTCADEGVWCMVQPASGGQCHFPDYDSSGNIVDFPNKAEFTAHADDDYENTIYAEFFRDYPNFIGFNYSEQFWGFESADFPVTPIQRYQHFAKLLTLCNKYGGYLNVNWCANQWSAPLNPIAMLKRCPEWRTACEKYSENLQLEEKYTQASFIQDVESEVLGAYLSGYCGNFGVRYDETGWTDSTWSGTGASSKDQYRQITGLPIHLERMVLNGATIIDGPELIWQDDFKETWGGVKDSEGYSCRNWETRDQYVNDTLDFFRKVVDGTIRIPTRQEVIDRTKVVIIQDNSTGDDHNKYSTYASLFEGLYRMPNDGNLKDNHNLYKSTGRYPTIPTVYALRDSAAKSFQVQIKQSSIPSRWSSISAKQDEFNKLFASDYYGNCYAARYENSWVTYNNNKDGSNCGAVLSLKYNTCKDLDVNFNEYGNALIKEYSDHIDIYANNFDEKNQTALRTDTFKISGCSAKPSYSAKDTGRNQTASQISESYSNGTYTLTVKHNGPVEISIKCSGSETGRLTSYKKSTVSAPASPSFYSGVRQYEGEFFDTKNVEGCVQNACGSGVTGIQGQGFMKFGKNSSAAVKDTVRTQLAGDFTFKLRYSTTSDTNNVDLYVNGSKVKTLSLAKGSSYSDWKTVSEKITLKQGDNKIELKANSALSASLYIDNFTVEGKFGDGTSQVIVNDQPLDGTLIKELTVSDKENSSDWSIYESFSAGSVLFGDRDITAVSIPASLAGAETVRTACDSKLYTSDLGTFKAGADITVYIAADSRVTASLPSWLSSWTKTAKTITTSNDVTLELFKYNFNSGETVTLGTNGGNNNSVNYIVLAVPKEAEPINGKLIKELTVFDNENAADWSVYYDIAAGSKLYGDRDITITSMPENLKNAEAVRTACDSKLSTNDLGKFTAAQDITVYAAVDTRVTANMPAWLKAWTFAGCSVKSSNDVTLDLYKLNVKKDQEVALGTNGGSNESANYIIMAVPQEKITKGDLNLDGTVDSFDMILARQAYTNGFSDTRSFDAADADKDEKYEQDDIQQLQKLLLGRISKFSENALSKPSPSVPTEPADEQITAIDGAAYMAQVSANILETEPSGATNENAGTVYGTYEKKTIYSDVCKRNKSFNVLLPAGYSTNKKYPVLYCLHGYWGDEDALLDKGDASLRLRQIIGNAIAAGEAEDMIVVFPDIYASDTQDKCDGLDAKNNAAYDNFINLLTKEIMPYMEQNYSIKTGRDNTAITGFSMGGRESLYIGFSRPDLFGYVGAMCPAPGLTTDLINSSDLKFTGTSPYLLFVSAGSDDTLIYQTPAGYHDTMNNNGVTHIWHYVTGGDHGGKTIRPHMYNFIRYIFKAA